MWPLSILCCWLEFLKIRDVHKCFRICGTGAKQPVLRLNLPDDLQNREEMLRPGCGPRSRMDLGSFPSRDLLVDAFYPLHQPFNFVAEPGVLANVADGR